MTMTYHHSTAHLMLAAEAQAVEVDVPRIPKFGPEQWATYNPELSAITVGPMQDSLAGQGWKNALR